MQIVNEITNEDFTVMSSLLLPVTGIPLDEFSSRLYNPSGDESSIVVTMSELGNGNYRAQLIPDTIGDWYLNVTHAIYFPWGKSGNIDVIASFLEVTGNKKRITQISDNDFVEDWYSSDQVTVIRTFNITRSGNVETRTPV